MIDDDPSPHRFAQGIGASCLLGGGVALLGFDNGAMGWTLTWVVIILAGINLLFNFCAGCFIYYQLDKFGRLTRSGVQKG